MSDSDDACLEFHIPVNPPRRHIRNQSASTQTEEQIANTFTTLRITDEQDGHQRTRDSDRVRKPPSEKQQLPKLQPEQTPAHSRDQRERDSGHQEYTTLDGKGHGSIERPCLQHQEGNSSTATYQGATRSKLKFPLFDHQALAKVEKEAKDLRKQLKLQRKQ